MCDEPRYSAVSKPLAHGGTESVRTGSLVHRAVDGINRRAVLWTDPDTGLVYIRPADDPRVREVLRADEGAVHSFLPSDLKTLREAVQADDALRTYLTSIPNPEQDPA